MYDRTTFWKDIPAPMMDGIRRTPGTASALDSGIALFRGHRPLCRFPLPDHIPEDFMIRSSHTPPDVKHNPRQGGDYHSI